MSIFTPRGLKVRVAVPYAFGLFTRLTPKCSPFDVLKTTEGIEIIPDIFAVSSGLFAFFMHLPSIQVGLLTFGAQFLGTLINVFGFHAIPGIVSLATFFSYISGYGIILLTACLVGYFLVGWHGVLAFIIGKLLAALVSLMLGFWQARRSRKLFGHALTFSEINFFSAYRFHASRIGVSTDINLHDREMSDDYWKPTFMAFAVEWPGIVQKFTDD